MRNSPAGMRTSLMPIEFTISMLLMAVAASGLGGCRGAGTFFSTTRAGFCATGAGCWATAKQAINARPTARAAIDRLMVMPPGSQAKFRGETVALLAFGTRCDAKEVSVKRTRFGPGMCLVTRNPETILITIRVFLGQRW